MEPTPQVKRAPFFPLRLWRRHRILLLIIILVLVVDQVTKSLVVATFELGESIPQGGIVRITYVENSGSAFGLFRGQTFFLILASLAGIAILAWFYRSHPNPGLLFKLSLGLQLGGAIGNLANRVVVGRVVDFIDLGPWPVFNLADASIVVGIIMLTWLFFGPQKAKERHASLSPATDASGTDRQADE